MTLLADLMLLLGTLFLFLAAVGLLRMPDVFTRLQAGTKAATLGALALLAGLTLLEPSWWPRTLLIALFLLLTSPVSSSTIARATLLSGQRPWRKGEREQGGDA